MNSKITELRNIYADKIIDSITTDDNWQAQGVVTLMKEYESKFKLLNLHDVSNNEVPVCSHEWTRLIINADNYQCCKCGILKEQTDC